MTHDSIASVYNYRAVSEALSTSGQPTTEQLASIAAAGYEAIINLALHDDPRYSLPDELGSVQSLGLSYAHIPVQFAAPSEADLMAFFAAMEANHGRKLWVHCAANYRVSTFLGLYRIIKQGWQHDQAFDLMNSLWQPNEVWSSFIEAVLAKHGG